jgi:glyoxylase-like metal-dependent hydrolase (beta-lactamase superfamily II)
MEMAPGVHWLRMPLPYQLNHINLWLLADGDGWVIVDTGINREETKQIWELLFAAKGIAEAGGAGGRVARVICTHFHPDHMGLAGWLTARLGAELWTTLGEWSFGRMVWLDQSGEGQKEFARHYARHGLDSERTAKIFIRGNTYRSVVGEPPISFHRIRGGETIAIGGREWEVIIGLGHAPEQACLYCPALKVLIAGDQILPKITPNIGVWASEPLANPLHDYLDSLKRYRPLPADTLVLPSHGFPFRGLHLRLDQLAAHHETRFARLRGAIGHEGKTAVELLPVLFPQELDTFQIGFAIGETVAHLHCMLGEGELAREVAGDGVVRFRAA